MCGWLQRIRAAWRRRVLSERRGKGLRGDERSDAAAGKGRTHRVMRSTFASSKLMLTPDCGARVEKE